MLSGWPWATALMRHAVSSSTPLRRSSSSASAGDRLRERYRAQQRPVAAPAFERRVAAADHDPHVGRQGREHRAAQPVVEHRQELEGVEDQDDALTACADRRGDLLDGGAAQRGQELALRGRDDVTVELDHDGAGLARLGREGVQERRLPDAGEAMDVGNDGPVGREQPPQLSAFALAAGDRARLLREQGSERLSHRLRRYGPGRPPVIGATTSYDARRGLDDAVPVRLPQAADRGRLPADLVGRPAGAGLRGERRRRRLPAAASGPEAAARPAPRSAP